MEENRRLSYSQIIMRLGEANVKSSATIKNTCENEKVSISQYKR